MSKVLTEGDWKTGVLVSGLHWFPAKNPPNTNREILMYFGDGIIISGEYCDGYFSVYGRNTYRSHEVIAWAKMITTPTQYGVAKVGR